jgi:endonuclease YncB( thermonuclease family)
LAALSEHPWERETPRRKPARKWERLDGCTLVQNRWNDGDSFHVLHRGRQYLFRLYFVDAPEAEHSLPARVDAQAAYFGITPEDSLAAGRAAGVFARQTLGEQAVSVWTRWRDALGRSREPRFYALVQTLAGRLGRTPRRRRAGADPWCRVPCPMDATRAFISAA